ncbi:MAG TPA: aldo/keto reductase [Vicinamibacterales bacterium]|nr:aldo/keto reductase [Vicinamibacterales bacterium]
MRYTQLGRSGLTVSRLALGCMSYGSPAWRPWVLDEAAARPFFVRAIEAGINVFDTADMYSLGASEEVTGRLLRDVAVRDEIVIATKVNFPMSDGPNMGGLSRKHVLQACEATLRRLGVEAIDLYQIHRFDPSVPADETLEALNDLVRAGKVRHIGASSGPAWRLAQALSTSERRGWASFVSMQNHYNLVYREEEREMVPLCLDAGIGLMPWSPLARGLLTRPRPVAGGVRHDATRRAASDDYSPRLYDHPADWDVVDAVEHVASARGVTMTEVALAWLLGRPGVVAPIIGATKLGHLDTAIRALDLALTPDELAALDAPYRPHAVRGFTEPDPGRRDPRPLPEYRLTPAASTTTSPARVNGIGGVFFKARDPAALSAWYRTHLGLQVTSGAPEMPAFEWRERDNPARVARTAWALFDRESGYLGPAGAQFMINYRVSDLDRLVARLRAAGIDVEGPAGHFNGRFAWLHDPDGNRVELWEPAAGW